MSKRKSIYRDILAEPIPAPNALEILCGVAEQCTSDRLLEKLNALAAHYRIALESPSFWRQLAWCLIRDNVPGFQVKRRRGRPGTSLDMAEARARLLKVFNAEVAANGPRGDLPVCETLRRRWLRDRRDYPFGSKGAIKTAAALAKDVRLARSAEQMELWLESLTRLPARSSSATRNDGR